MISDFLFIAGPCAIESKEIVDIAANKLSRIAKKNNLNFVFKASFEKANRTSRNSFRGLGINDGLKILKDIKDKYSIKVITDVHETSQVQRVAEVVDYIQIPALLSRQTPLLESVDKTKCIINIKKGQFYSYKDIEYMIKKCPKALKENRLFVTERGNSFGYNDIIVDFRSLPKIRQKVPVIFDATHSIQQPSINKGKSSGDKSLIPYLARAASIIGVDGIYLETHPFLKKAKSDKDIMLDISEVENLWLEILEVNKLFHELSQKR